MSNTDVGFALEAKSDQLNAVDIIGAEPIIKIRRVDVKKGEQPVSVYFDGDNNKPWKPSKGMLRILSGAWGRESVNWVGKYAQIYFEPSVKFAGQEIGGIRIRSLSDIDENGLQFALTINRAKREPYHVPCLIINKPPYPEAKFNDALPAMIDYMKSGRATLQQIIAKCQETGTLSNDQLRRLEEAAPIEIHADESGNIE